MAIIPTQLIGISARHVESFVLRVGAASYIFLVKSYTGTAQREIEIFTVADMVAALAGPLFFNIRPTPLPAFQHNFHLASAVITAGNTMRIYYNPSSLGLPRDIQRIDIDPITLLPPGAVATELFIGVDPFILDGRTGAAPNRLILVYITAARQNAFRISTNLGATWGIETLIDDVAATDHNYVEANINDPTTRRDYQVLQQRDS